jgi:hypothetical protein
MVAEKPSLAESLSRLLAPSGQVYKHNEILCVN